MTPGLALGQVALAGLLGGAIGFERELGDKPAGLRTHILVAAGACLFAVLGTVAVTRLAAHPGVPTEVIQADPIRILEAILTGIGFLGAGTIVVWRGDVEGLTTAGSILVAAAIGTAVALEQWVLALGVTVLVVIVLYLLGKVEQHMHRTVLDDED